MATVASVVRRLQTHLNTVRRALSQSAIDVDGVYCSQTHGALRQEVAESLRAALDSRGPDAIRDLLTSAGFDRVDLLALHRAWADWRAGRTCRPKEDGGDGGEEIVAVDETPVVDLEHEGTDAAHLDTGTPPVTSRPWGKYIAYGLAAAVAGYLGYKWWKSREEESSATAGCDCTKV